MEPDPSSGFSVLLTNTPKKGLPTFGPRILGSPATKSAAPGFTILTSVDKDSTQEIG